jgi:hypothetical protein
VLLRVFGVSIEPVSACGTQALETSVDGATSVFVVDGELAGRRARGTRVSTAGAAVEAPKNQSR